MRGMYYPAGQQDHSKSFSNISKMKIEYICNIIGIGESCILNT